MSVAEKRRKTQLESDKGLCNIVKQSEVRGRLSEVGRAREWFTDENLFFRAKICSSFLAKVKNQELDAETSSDD